MAKVLIAPDSFKGSATSYEVASALAQGWHEVNPDDEITLVAFADGGEGTLLSIEHSVRDSVRVPVLAQSGDGRERDCYWLLVNGDIAVIEMAMICGITTMNNLDPCGAHSFGLGQVIKAALGDARVNEIYIAVGGSASTDAGVGALMALGVECVDKDGILLRLGGSALNDLDSVEMECAFRMPSRGIKILTDVQSPMTGPHGAAYVFAPQKGASTAEVETLESGLKNFLKIIGVEDRAGYGAAGGVSGGLAAVLGATIVSGVEVLAEITGVLRLMENSDLVITGEGSFDNQSFQGKVVGYLLQQAQMRKVPAVIACGVNKTSDDNRVLALVDIAPSVHDAISNVQQWAQEAGRLLAQRYRL